MKLIATLIASAFAVSAFAAEPAKKEEVKPATPTAAVTAPAVSAKNETKPVKSEKKDSTKVEVKAPAAK